jgi:hypothetical protein
MIPLMLAMAAGQGLLGAVNAEKNNKEAARRDKQNTELSAHDARYAALGKGKSNMYQQVMDEKSVLGAGLGGGLSGAMQGMNIYQGMQNQGAQQALLEKLSKPQRKSVYDSLLTPQSYDDYYMNEVK